MTDKKVLVITYYWPPSGGSGVQRWLKFVKYLPAYGWTPYVFTPENPAYDLRDESLLRDVPAEAEVIHFPIWEPYAWFARVAALFGKRKVGMGIPTIHQRSVFDSLAIWLRGNLFVPDPRRFWVRPSVKFLNDFIKEAGIQTVITTGPPHSVHLIGLGLKKRNPSIKWLADFRDPWSQWGFLDSLRVGTIARGIHRKLEKRVLSQADIVTTITPFYVHQFSNLANQKVTLLTNGYDDADFKQITVTRSNQFLIRHVGIVNEKCNPRPFLKAVSSVIHSNRVAQNDVCIEFIGEVHPQFRIEVEQSELKSVVKFTGSVPHEALLQLYGSSSLLLLILTGYKDAEGYMPGKLFEYLATGLPILGVGPTAGDAARLLSETGSGVMIDSDDVNGISATLSTHYDNWKSGVVPVKSNSNGEYSRKQITGKLVELL